MTTTINIPPQATKDVAICANPIFVMGSPRSGTTILATALGKHTGLKTFDESEFLFELFGEGRIDTVFQKAIDRANPSWLKANSVSHQEFLQYLGYGINALFTTRSHGRRWIEQTPHYGLMADTLAGMFPGAQFIHILRDPRQVVHSMVNVTQRYTPQDLESAKRTGHLPPWPEDFRSACRAWRDCVERSLEFCAANPDRGMTVHYKNLIAAPQREFRRILDFLGLDPEDGPARFFSGTRINSSFHRDYSTPTPQEQSAEPWLNWTDDRKVIFLDELGGTLAKHGLPQATDIGTGDYDQFLAEILALCKSVVPPGSIVLFISKGEEQLMNLVGRQAWHFPRDTGGAYSGTNPGCAAEALEHLQSLRAGGARFIVIPKFTMWWLDYYSEFAEYLRIHGRMLIRNDNLCAIFDLDPDTE